jgi:uncharacterized protein (DUF488 family)
MNPLSTTVYTIGHSRHTLAYMAKLLQEHRIKVLVDVRSRPQSRWVPHFNKKYLETALPKVGIDYQYLGKQLGGRPDDSTLYKPNPNRKRKKDPATVVDYRKVARQDWFQDSISKLIEVASGRRTVILCAEEDPRTCHRSQLVGDTLTKRGIEVVHIRGSGNLEPQGAC